MSDFFSYLSLSSKITLMRFEHLFPRVIAAVLLSAILFLTSCDSGEDSAPAPQRFDISVSDRIMTGATVTVEPSRKDTYYVSVDNRAEVEALCATDEEYIRMKLDFIRVMAGVNGLSVEEYLARELSSGISVHQVTDLYYDTEYCVGVFGLNSEGAVTTGLTFAYFRTESFAPSAECRFIIQEVACTASSIEVEVGASDPAVRYYAAVMTSDEFASYETLNEAVADIIFSAELFDDVDWSDPSFTHAGRNRLLFEGLEPDTEYVVIVFGVSAEGEQTTDAASETFRTEAA